MNATYGKTETDMHRYRFQFQWAPTLGGECYVPVAQRRAAIEKLRFNGHPPLGVNATSGRRLLLRICAYPFQWAPTLGGECYGSPSAVSVYRQNKFQWAPTLGGECYHLVYARRFTALTLVSMGTHPWG